MLQSLKFWVSTPVKCSQGHALKLTNDLAKTDLKYKDGTYGCNSCNKFFHSKTHLCAHCIPCEFDLCPSCLQDQEKQLKLSKNSAKTPVQCSGGHDLILTNDLRGTDPKYRDGKYGCNDCGNLFDSKTHRCAHCIPCEFDLCPACLQAQENKQKLPKNANNLSVLCPQGHKLLLTNDLKSTNPKYLDGTYGCNFCGKPFNSKTHICAHCIPCEFDLCPTCFEGYRQRGEAQQEPPKNEEIVAGVGNLSIEEKPKASGAGVRKDEEKPQELGIKKEEVKQDGGKSEKVISEDKLCVVCMEVEKDHLFIPCGHLCVCEKCSSDVMNAKGNCPICRVQIQSKIRVYS